MNPLDAYFHHLSIIQDATLDPTAMPADFASLLAREEELRGPAFSALDLESIRPAVDRFRPFFAHLRAQG